MRQYLGRNGPKYGAGAPVLVEGIDPETGNPGYFEGKIGFEELFVVLALLVVHDVVDEIMDLLVIHRRQVDTANIPVHANHWRQAGGQV